MDLIIRTPGLIDVAEKIFSNLERKDLLQCQQVNEYWASILLNPWFWHKRMKKINKFGKKLSQENQDKWTKFCEKLSETHFTKNTQCAGTTKF